VRALVDACWFSVYSVHTHTRAPSTRGFFFIIISNPLCNRRRRRSARLLFAIFFLRVSPFSDCRRSRRRRSRVVASARAVTAILAVDVSS